MAFDIDQAKKAGYSDSEIADFLKKQHANFDVDGAMKAGYTLKDIADRTNKPAPQSSSPGPVMSAIKTAINSNPVTGILDQGSAALAKLPPEAQRGTMAAAGAEIGLPAGPIASGIVSAGAGGLMEAAQNPRKAGEVMTPIIKTALAPTSENVLNTMKEITQPGSGDFMKRRGVEFGTAAAGGAVLKGMRGMKVEGPITAGMENPSLVFKTVRERILNELGDAKAQAMTGESLSEGQRLMKMLRTPGGQGKLADEAIKAVEQQSKLSNTQLLAYEEALGKTQTKGGTFTEVYQGARNAIRSQLKEQAPTLFKYKALARKVFQSQGQGEAATSLIKAIQNPISSAATMPGVQRGIGAGVRTAAEGLFPGFVGSADVLSNSLMNLAKKRKQGQGS